MAIDECISDRHGPTGENIDARNDLIEECGASPLTFFPSVSRAVAEGLAILSICGKGLTSCRLICAGSIVGVMPFRSDKLVIVMMSHQQSTNGLVESS